ncbi:efflux RND transporter periplasmic adaptor subunit [Imhoffiella purpurea]|uniref:Putative RND efflux membrane fusion protein n=1 Tax=Imhoffiella purpurea TaxID=1249627 RepID=W9VFI0_9GAMM|nr:efflux RND transporter periplasmic adaptor subunit [Imhoffiella purpurea]EXJ14802.1 Putative RND efflux membrane fusion protein [Imhoffiella purpurea]
MQPTPQRILASIALVLLAAGSIWLIWIDPGGLGPLTQAAETEEKSESAPDGSEREETDGASRPPPLVEVAEARRAEVRQRLSTTGTLIASEKVTLTTEASGRVVAVGFEDGDRVRRGQVLLELERTRGRAEVRRAEASLEERRRELARLRELRAQDFVSEDELESATTAMEHAEASLTVARDQLDDRSLKAPFEGVVGRRLVSPGAVVEPGTPVTELVQLDPLDVLLDIPGSDAARARVGLHVEVETPAYPDRTFSGKVTYVGTQVEESTRSLPLEARIDNHEGLLRPGMLAVVALLLEPVPVIQVPEAAILARGPSQRVYVVDDSGRVERRIVETSLRRNGWVGIASGVEAGESVVTEGLGMLRDGMRVRVKDADEPQGDEAS